MKKMNCQAHLCITILRRGQQQAATIGTMLTVYLQFGAHNFGT